MKRSHIKVFVIICVNLLVFQAVLNAARLEIKDDASQGHWRATINDQEILVYQYGKDVDLPHYWPLRSPSGKNMLTQKEEPYPHHRSLWFADTVYSTESARKVSLYSALYTGQSAPGEAAQPNTSVLPPYRDHVRHVAFSQQEIDSTQALVKKQLVWEFDDNKPILNEERSLRIVDLGQGEYLLDMRFKLTASYSDVDFVSDKVHYAWPYIRINKTFNGEHGGTITSDTGATGQKATDGQIARWIDYSNTVEGITEGMAVFQWPDGKDHRWLTREYGCFGPRRPDELSGKKFTLNKGQSITQRIGILVHRGNVKTGRIAERYAQYINGEL